MRQGLLCLKLKKRPQPFRQWGLITEIYGFGAWSASAFSSVSYMDARSLYSGMGHEQELWINY